MLLRNNDWDLSHCLRIALYWEEAQSSCEHPSVAQNQSHNLKESFECRNVKMKGRDLEAGLAGDA